jgi:excisionase family DNA binding protein/PAS domain S-box-containing protein
MHISKGRIERRESRLLSLKEAAAYLQVSQTTIYRLVQRSQIPAFKVGGNWRFNIESIDAWRLGADSASPRPNPAAADATAVLPRIYEAMSHMLGKVTELSRLRPTLKRIAEAIEDKRDTSDEIRRLYESEPIAFRTLSENLLRFVPTAFGAVDRDRHLVSFNDSYCQLFGFRRKHLRSVCLTDLVHSDDLESFIAVNARMWRGNTKSACFVGRRLRGSGEAMPTKSTVWPIRPAATAPPKYIAASLERLANQEEASALFTRCADQLSKRRENFLARR